MSVFYRNGISTLVHRISPSLQDALPATTWWKMTQGFFRGLKQSEAWRLTMLTLGWMLVLGAPLLGPIPGPGPLLILPIGLALILKNSRWAKKRYARLARRHPEYGRWADWAMRRSKATERPPFPDLKSDLMHLFRRDDIDQTLP